MASPDPSKRSPRKGELVDREAKKFKFIMK
jgi:hypothetical protein